MNVLRRIVLGLAGVVAVALAMQLAAPKAVQAIVSHFVTVDNTAANPVPVAGTVAVSSLPAVQLSGNVNATVTNGPATPVPTFATDDPGRIPFQAAEQDATACNGQGICFLQFGTVPAGHRIVIKHVSGALFTAASSQTIVTVGPFNGAGLAFESFMVGPGRGTGFPVETVFDQPVQFYFDQGQAVEVSLNATSTFISGTSALMTLTGYELDCTVAPCGPIQSKPQP